MKCSVIISLLLVAVATAADEEGYQVIFAATSVRSHIFAPLRVNKTAVLTSECGKEVTEPLGILAHKFKKGSAKNEEKCTWKLHAPANHVVNVISVVFATQDEIKPSASDDDKTTVISLYDGPEPGNGWSIRYEVSRREKAGPFFQSISSKQDLYVEIKYHDSKEFAAQKILINYEFLDYDTMAAYLRAYPNQPDLPKA